MSISLSDKSNTLSSDNKEISDKISSFLSKFEEVKSSENKNMQKNKI